MHLETGGEDKECVVTIYFTGFGFLFSSSVRPHTSSCYFLWPLTAHWLWIHQCLAVTTRGWMATSHHLQQHQTTFNGNFSTPAISWKHKSNSNDLEAQRLRTKSKATSCVLPLFTLWRRGYMSVTLIATFERIFVILIHRFTLDK